MTTQGNGLSPTERSVRFALSVLSGILNGIAFIWVGELSLLANVPLLLALHHSPKLVETIVLGGVVGFIAGLHIYGIAHYGWFLLITFSFYTASQMMLYGGVFYILWRHLDGFGRLFLPVCLWVLTEWIRTLGPYSMPASYVGNIALTQWLSPWLYLAPMMGGLFVSGCVALTQSAIFLSILNFRDHRSQIYVTGTVIILIGCVGFHWSPNTAGEPLQVSGIQAGLHNGRYDAAKVDPLSREEIISTFEFLTQHALQHEPNLIVWPETAIRETVLSKPRLSSRLFAPIPKQTSLIAGLHLRKSDRLYNAAVVIENATPLGHVSKRKLVMGTEAHFTPGLTHTPLRTQHGLIGVMICLEAVYGRVAYELVHRGAEILVVMSNDAGFGYSPITHHMTRRAVVRALETGRWLIRVGQAGLSVIVSPRGRIVEELALFKPEVLSGKIYRRRERTGYVMRPWLTPALNLILLGYLCALACLRRSRSKPSPIA